MIGYLRQNHALVSAFNARGTRLGRREKFQHARVFKMAPKLSDYFPEGEILAAKGALDRPISGLAIDSRRVAAGNLFFALPGRRADGARFIDEAISRGAVAIVTSKIPGTPPARVTYLQVADPRAALARVAQRYYHFPDRDLRVVGVTGTNGKTTVTHLIKNFLNGESRVGLIGTINYDLGTRTVPSFRTTPEALDLYGMLAQMRDAGCRDVAMEVSSHGIDQQRVLGMEFSAAVFTNLTRDHLDYHQTLEAYFAVKQKLFTGEVGRAPKVGVVNLDDAHGRTLAARIAREFPGERLVTFGTGAEGMVRATDIELKFRSAEFRLHWPDGEMRVSSPLLGQYNVSNVLAAAATAWALGRDPQKFLANLSAFKGVPGRMERIEAGQPFNVLVDYAHTDDALRNALGMLRAITPGKLLVVFGCGGNRDRSKRPLMVEAVAEYADHAYATADNPRGESIAQIFSDMQAGVKKADAISWIDDRRRAISVALDQCRPGDCLLVAGKGHESYQEFADTVVPFDDRQVVRELIGIKALKT